MRLLITGINGLIGTVLRNALQKTHTVYGLDREGEFSEQVLSADISEYGQVAQAVQQCKPLDSIVHLAGNPKVDASWESVLNANIIGTRNIFEAAREFQVPQVVYASSNHVTGAYHGFEPSLYKYTEPGPPMISPEDPIRPDSDYGLSKAFGEAVARYYFDRWGIRAICLRIGAVLEDDDPTKQSQNRRIWLSHRDLVQLVEKSLTADVTFGIYYGISNNKDAFWDISNARADLGFEPIDDGSAR
ncbi:MAG TPA: NAD(P)-dependent oxidoreductase [Anaerolineales bacterium]|jgi:nucleoside-diphosphate-sugar epimerase|nr:NAD(P)-dependent oxidoreductase [Anaerolineales bacterium]